VEFHLHQSFHGGADGLTVVSCLRASPFFPSSFSTQGILREFGSGVRNVFPVPRSVKVSGLFPLLQCPLFSVAGRHHVLILPHLSSRYGRPSRPPLLGSLSTNYRERNTKRIQRESSGRPPSAFHCQPSFRSVYTLNSAFLIARPCPWAANLPALPGFASRACTKQGQFRNLKVRSRSVGR